MQVNKLCKGVNYMELFVVFGGQSSEHEVSIQSALNILENAGRGNFP